MNILCGYNVNIDSVYRISGAEVTALLDTLDRAEVLDKIENPPGMIRSISDFTVGLVYCMKTGRGAEWLVQEPAVFEFLKESYFEKSLVRLGGNAGIMANVLSELGALQVVPNIAVPSKAQLSLFSKKTVVFPILPGKKPCSSESTTMSARQNQDPIHFVFDFSDGDSFSLFGEEFTVPKENRFIATFDQLNLRLFINPAFEAYARAHIREMDGALISGFHILLETYPEGTTYLDKIEKAFKELKAWKIRNEKLEIHVEFGHFSSKEMGRNVFLKFAGLVDSFGMNEEELAMLQPLHQVPPEGIIEGNAKAVAKAAVALASEYGLSHILIHTREFGFSAFRIGTKEPESGISNIKSPDVPESRDIKKENSEIRGLAQKELEALRFGIECAGAFAASGRLEGRDYVEKTMQNLQRSDFGKVQVRKFIETFKGEPCQEGAFAYSEGYTICLLPTLLCKGIPVSTVGLGDTFTAAMFLRRLELRVQA